MKMIDLDEKKLFDVSHPYKQKQRENKRKIRVVINKTYDVKLNKKAPPNGSALFQKQKMILFRIPRQMLFVRLETLFSNLSKS